MDLDHRLAAYPVAQETRLDEPPVVVADGGGELLDALAEGAGVEDVADRG